MSMLPAPPNSNDFNTAPRTSSTQRAVWSSACNKRSQQTAEKGEGRDACSSHVASKEINTAQMTSAALGLEEACLQPRCSSSSLHAAVRCRRRAQPTQGAHRHSHVLAKEPGVRSSWPDAKKCQMLSLPSKGNSGVSTILPTPGLRRGGSGLENPITTH